MASVVIDADVGVTSDLARGDPERRSEWDECGSSAAGAITEPNLSVCKESFDVRTEIGVRDRDTFGENGCKGTFRRSSAACNADVEVGSGKPGDFRLALNDGVPMEVGSG